MARYSFRKAIKALSVGALSAVGVAMGGSAIAQNLIVPDASLGLEEASVIQPFREDVDFILGGARRGENLFHSFEEFNIGKQSGAYFAFPSGFIRNIFARVTGDNVSEISGLLGTLQIFEDQFFQTDANLYFINPNGVIFGENAALAVGGSFSVATAESLLFEDEGSFNTSNPTLPSNLLVVNPSAYLFDSTSIGNVTSRSTRLDPSRISAVSGLSVSTGENITFLGRDVFISGNATSTSGLGAAGGEINIGAVFGEGRVLFNDAKGLIFSDSLERGHVKLDEASISVGANGSGGIRIAGQNITLNSSTLYVGGAAAEDLLREPRILNESAITNETAGSIILEADETIEIKGGGVFNFSYNNGTSGDINIEAGRLTLLSDETLISSTTLGSYNAGSLNINTYSLLVENGAWLSASTFSGGDSGDISIVADNIILKGIGQSGRRSEIYSDVGGRSTGQGGNITIDSDLLQLNNGARISTETAGEGGSGSIFIAAHDITASGGASISSSTVGNGSSGSVLIEAKTANFIGRSEDGSIPSSVLSFVSAEGRSGGINLIIDSLSLQNGAEFSTETSGNASASNILVQAKKILIDDSSMQSAVSGVDTRGNGGNITILAEVLQMRNGGLLLSGTSGIGNGGNILIQARDIEIIGDPARESFSNTAAVTASLPGSRGRGGNIFISSDTLKISMGGGLVSSSLGLGKAGNVGIDTSQVSLSGGDISTSAFPGTGDGGNISIESSDFIILLDDSDIIASSAQGRGGNITFQTPAFFREIKEGFDPDVQSDISDNLDGNDRVDIDATGTVDGVVTEPDMGAALFE